MTILFNARVTPCVMVIMLALQLHGIALAEGVDVEMRLLTLEAPSAVTDTTDLGGLPGLKSAFGIGESFVLELWVSDVGTLNTGIIGFFADLSFDGTVVTVNALHHSPGAFTLLSEGTVDNLAGQVVNFGGNDGTFSGQGVEPVWARLGYIELTALANGTTAISTSLGLGGVGVLGRLPPDISEILLGSITVVVEDCNANGILDACDIDCGPLGGPCDLPGCGQSEDCNLNGIPDSCDLDSGSSGDANGNGIPDECEAQPDQLHIVGPIPNRVPVGTEGAITATVQAGFVGLPGWEVVLTKLAGSFTFTAGMVSPDGSQSAVTTDTGGAAQMTFVADTIGGGLIGVSITGSNVPAAYAVFEIVAPSPLIPGDCDADGDVDLDDVDEFCAVLLGADANARHIAAADVNGDGVTDGRDIDALVDLLAVGP